MAPLDRSILVLGSVLVACSPSDGASSKTEAKTETKAEAKAETKTETSKKPSPPKSTAQPSIPEICRVDTLPTSQHGNPTPDRVVVRVARTQLCVGSTPVVPMVDGSIDPEFVDHHLIEPLFSVLEAEASGDDSDVTAIMGRPPSDGGAPPSPQPLSLEAPPLLEFDTLINILYSAGRAGFGDYQVGVQNPDGTRGYFKISPPPVMGMGPATKVKVLVQSTGFTVMHVGGDVAPAGGGIEQLPLSDSDRPITDLGRWDVATLARSLHALAGANPKTKNITVSAERDIPIQLLIAVMDAAVGTDCPPEVNTDDDIARCQFPFVTIEAGAG